MGAMRFTWADAVEQTGNEEATTLDEDMRCDYSP